MGIKLIADVGEKINIIKGAHVGKTGEILSIHGHGTVSEFLELYEPAYEILTSDGKVQMRLNSEDISAL